MGYDTFVASTFVEGTLVEWNIGRTEHSSNGTFISGSQPVGRDPKRGRDTNAMGSLIDFDPNVNII